MDHNKRKMKCLFCFSAVGDEAILSEDILNEESDITVADLIRAYFPIAEKILASAHIDGICRSCWLSIDAFHEFCTSVQNNYETEGDGESIQLKSEDLLDDDMIVFEVSEGEDEIGLKEEEQEFDAAITEAIVDEQKQSEAYSTKNSSVAEAAEDQRIRETAKMQCELCQVPLESLRDAKSHYKSAHGVDGYIVCCQRKFKQKCRLVEHINTHYNLSYPCPQCDKTFDSKAYLTKHLACHETVKQFSCDHCPKSFAKKFQVRNHLLSVHIFDNVLPELECPIENCFKKFVNHARLKHHVDYTHSLASGNFEICEICSKAFKSKGALELHRKTHTRKMEDRIKCEICGHYLGDIKSYNRHVKNHATESLENICTYCGKKSPNLNALKKHIRYVHEMAKNYNCRFCDKQFKRPRNLIDHEASVHTLSDIYQCTFCSKKFRNQSNMLSHRKRQHPDQYQPPVYMRDNIDELN